MGLKSGYHSMLHTLSVQTLRPKKRCQVNLHMLSHMSVASCKIWLTFTRSMSWGNCAGLPALHENMMHTLHAPILQVPPAVQYIYIYYIYDYCIYHRFSLSLYIYVYVTKIHPINFMLHRTSKECPKSISHILCKESRVQNAKVYRYTYI